MFGILARALLKSVRRDLGGYASLRTNNFFLFVALLIAGALESGVEPASSYPFLLLLGLLLLFPASGDPLEKIPRVRLAMWPVPALTRVALRLASLAFSPAFWLLVAMLWIRATVGMVLGFVVLIAAI